MNRDEILKQLREGVITVTFTKLNGDEREMDCTLNMNTIPQGWRSFLVDKVKKVV